MKRQEKFPETSTFHYYNANPKNRITGDCTFRAICTACEITWEEAVMGWAETVCETKYEGSKSVELFLKKLGWVKQPQPRKADNTKYTGKEFCKQIAKKNKRYIANIGGHHIVAIINGKVYDIWDSTDGTIGNYWTKE